MGLALQMRPSLPRIRDGARSAALPCRVLAKVNRADGSAKHKVWNSISCQSTVPIITTIVNPLATTRGVGGREINVEPKRPAKEAGGGHLELRGAGRAHASSQSSCPREEEAEPPPTPGPPCSVPRRASAPARLLCSPPPSRACPQLLPRPTCPHVPLPLP